MQKKIGIGIIGCGFISSIHAKAILKIPTAILVGAFDVNEENKNKFAKEFKVTAFDTLNEMLTSKEIDAVCICSPSGFHKDLSLQAIKMGKHIIVEKPMALTVKDADEIIKACEKYNVKCTVISQLRYSDAVKKVKMAVDNGWLGKLLIGDIFMKYYRSPEYYSSSKWKGTWKMDGGGALMNQGIHGVDILQYIMGPIKSVYAISKTMARQIEVEDTVCALAEYKNGAIGTIQATTSVYPGFERRMEICGDSGSIIMKEDSIAFWDLLKKDNSFEVNFDAATVNASNDPANIANIGHTTQISDFIDCILHDKTPFVDCYEGKKSIEIITSIYQSAKTGQPVFL